MLRNKVHGSWCMVHGLSLKLSGAIILGFVLYLCASYAQDMVTYDAQGKRDPFIPLVTPDGRLLKLEQPSGSAALSLEGIIYDKEGISYAVVGGEVVKIGDEVSGYQVLKIEQDKVIFIKDGEPMEIELKEEEQ